MEDFVTFELAVKLKEKGYPQDIQHCIGWYPTEYYKNSCIGEYFEGELQEIEDYFEDRISAIHITENEKKGVIAPTISQVLKWLREEKLILIGLSPMQEYDGNEMIEWCSTIYKADKQGGMSWMEELYYESYEQAALAGIEYALDNLI